MPKYTTVKVSGVIISIGKVTDTPGYVEVVLESMLPDETKMSDKQSRSWIKSNNSMMIKVCRLMNDHNV